VGCTSIEEGVRDVKLVLFRINPEVETIDGFAFIADGANKFRPHTSTSTISVNKPEGARLSKCSIKLGILMDKSSPKASGGFLIAFNWAVANNDNDKDVADLDNGHQDAMV
jgi:hypothetical protein